jgi:hypothetical protein
VLAQSNYYVATTGVDTNAGTLASPWKTIQYGCNQLSAGDTLNILAGTYAEKIDLDVSGTAGAYITIQNYQNDEVILNTINFNDDNAIIWTDNAYLIIKGLHLTNNIYNFASGLALQGAAHHIKILNNKISNIKFDADPNATITSNTNAVPLGIYADSATNTIHNITVRGNEVFNNQTGYSENISAGGNFTDFIIEDNIVHDNTNIGIDIGGNYGTCPTAALDHGRNGIIRNNLVYNCNAPYSTAAGIYIDGGWDIVVENNICHHNGYGGEIGCEENGTTKNIIFRNNIFYKNYYSGMHVGGYDVNTTGNVLNSSVYNNTFYQNDTGNNYNGELLLTQSQACTFNNNIFYVSAQNVYIQASRTQTNLLVNYNLVYADAGIANVEVEVNGTNYTGLSSYYAASGQGANSSFANPLFIDASTFDFHLLTTSPAIDAGNPSYTMATGEVDMDDEARINNSIIDCGADEYYSTVVINNPVLTGFIVYPNPTNTYLKVPNTMNNSLYYIYNRQGKMVAKGFVNSQLIPTENLIKGAYIVTLINNENKHSFKIIKQ